MATSKSDSQILQEFVANLLSQPEIEIDAELVEPKSILAVESSNDKPPEKILSAKLTKSEIKITAISEKPLFSEKIQRAQKLLKTMPEQSDLNQHPELSELPTVLLRNDLINKVSIEHSDEIIIRQEIEASIEDIVDAQQQAIASPLEDGIPQWGRGSFQSLIFNIGELKLAVPLVKLGGIHKIDPQLTPLPEKPDWYLGLVADSIGNISVIDTALWIMPEKYAQAKTKGLNYELVVLLDKSRWGLACSGVDNAITLSEKDIRWNRTKSKRPWLAGMVVEEMCALIDVDSLLKMLQSDSSEPTSIANS